MIDQVITHKWHTHINKEYVFSTIALIDLRADMNCINEGIVPSKYFLKTMEVLNIADRSKLVIKYKLFDVAICDEGICIDIPFILRCI